MVKHTITYEITAYTDAELHGLALSPGEIANILQVWPLNDLCPPHVSAVQSMTVIEDEGQEEDDRRIFIDVVLSLNTPGYPSASRSEAPAAFLNALLAYFNRVKETSLTAQDPWDVTEIS